MSAIVCLCPLPHSCTLHFPFFARTWLVAFVTDASAGRNFERLITQRRLGTRPEGAPASSGPGPQQHHAAEVGAGAAHERRKQAGKDARKGCSLAKVGAAILRIAARMRVQTEGVQLSS